MKKSFLSLLQSGQAQLNFLGLFILSLLGLAAWKLIQSFTWVSLFPLILISYSAWRICFELTLNRRNVPTLATSSIGRKKIAEIFARESRKSLKEPYRIVDLGSGRGELTRAIARAAPSAEVLGVELARVPLMQARLITRLCRLRNLSYALLDFWRVDFKDVDAVYLFIFPTLAVSIGKKLKRDLKKGAVVISHSFPLGEEWIPAEILEYRSPFKSICYIYRQD